MTSAMLALYAETVQHDLVICSLESAASQMDQRYGTQQHEDAGMCKSGCIEEYKISQAHGAARLRNHHGLSEALRGESRLLRARRIWCRPSYLRCSPSST